MTFIEKDIAQEILQEILDKVFEVLNVSNIAEADKLSLLDSLIVYEHITDKVKELADKYELEIRGL